MIFTTLSGASVNPVLQYRFFDDFDVMEGASTPGKWAVLNGGTPGVVSISPAQVGHRGLNSLNTDPANVSTIGRCAIQQQGLKILLGEVAVSFDAYVEIVDLSTVAQEYDALIGITDTFVPASIAHGIYLAYNRLVFGNNWHLVCEAGGAQTALDLGIAATVGWQKIGFTCNAARTSVQGRGSIGEGSTPADLGAPITTNIPAAAQEILPDAHILKSAGGTNRIFRLDYVDILYPVVR